MPKYGYRQNPVMLVFTIQDVRVLIIVIMQRCQCICGVDAFVKAPVRAAQLTFVMNCGYVCGCGGCQTIYFSLQNTDYTNEQCRGCMQQGNNIGLLRFSLKACSRSSKRRLSTSSYLSAHVSAPLPLEGFPRNLILRTFIKICRENPNLFTSRQEYGAHFMRTSVRFIVAGDIKSP